MHDFILDEELKNVKNEKTKKYLKEVISTYYNGNYRSCIVLLYSIVIFDFIEKLQILKDVYQDSSAQNTLNTFQSKQNDNAKYSELENIIIKAVCDKKVLNEIEILQFNELRNTRNLCAHPVLKNNYELFNPTKEQTLACIGNMFNAVFLKDAILNNKIYDDFLDKLVDFYERSELVGLEKYLNGRYFSKMNETTKKYIFRNLWSLTFYGTDDDCVNNRRALCNALIFLMKTDTKMFIDYFKENTSYLSSKILCEKVEIEFDDKEYTFYDYPIFSLIYFLSEFPQLYHLISSEIKVEIENICFKNINLLLLSSFISPNMEQHINIIKTKINGYNYYLSSEVFLKAYENSKNTNSTSLLREFAIYYFCNCMASNYFYPDYDYINWTYKDIISKILPNFNKQNLSSLLTGMNTIYTQAKIFPQLKSQIIDLVTNGIDINLAEYTISHDW